LHLDFSLIRRSKTRKKALMFGQQAKKGFVQNSLIPRFFMCNLVL